MCVSSTNLYLVCAQPEFIHKKRERKGVCTLDYAGIHFAFIWKLRGEKGKHFGNTFLTV